MSRKLSVKFYPKKAFIRKNGRIPILVKFSCEGTDEFLSHIDVDINTWVPTAQKVKGYSSEAKEINSELEKISDTLKRIKKELEDKGELPDAKRIKRIYTGKDKQEETKPLSLIELYDEFLVKQKEYVKAKLLSQKTHSRYVLTLKRLKIFLQDKLKRNDIEFKDLTIPFIEDFETFLLIDCNLCRNTAAKPLKYLKKIVKEAIKKKIISVDPFIDFKIRTEKTYREFLTNEELKSIIDKPLNERLGTVRDTFIFSCFTGLPYSDMETLTKKDIYVSENNEYWIITYRNKTEVKAQIPLCEIPVALLQKYHYDNKLGKIFPIASNQKVNEYLKEIAAICGIEKELTYHYWRQELTTLVIYRELTTLNHSQSNLVSPVSFFPIFSNNKE